MRTTPDAATAAGMLRGLTSSHICGSACEGQYTLGDGTVIDLTCPYSRLDPENPADARTIASLYASEARAAIATQPLPAPVATVTARAVTVRLSEAPHIGTIQPLLLAISYARDSDGATVSVAGANEGGEYAALELSEEDAPVWMLPLIEENRPSTW